MKRLLIMTCAAASVFAALADGETWQSRLPLHDAFVRDIDPDATFGADEGLVAGNNRESCMMFDVSGLANVTAAKIKFYITQCGTAEGDSHITFHTCAYDPECEWNFGIIPRERAQGVSQAAQIVFTFKNWVKRGTKIVVR